MMPLSLSIDELVRYNQLERDRWDDCFQRQPEALRAPLQNGHMFGTVWELMDHIFVVERRHLQRLLSEYPLPDKTGVEAGDWPGLREYGLVTRERLKTLISAVEAPDVPRPLPIMGETRMVSPRKVLFHVFLHEMRHWAQISLALRNAGFEPPDDQDLIFSSALG